MFHPTASNSLLAYKSRITSHLTTLTEGDLSAFTSGTLQMRLIALNDSRL
ncbi:MAG: hypothetical protein AAFS12_11135 [Cyanobacteria bacterium J06632_19]